MLGDVDRLILPGITHWQSPDFFAFFPANTSGPSILGELLSAGWACRECSAATGPPVAELEAHVLDWLVDMLGLPDKFRSHGAGGGVVQDTASSAVLAGTHRGPRALHRRPCQPHQGCDGQLTAYASSPVRLGCSKGPSGIAGLGRANLRLLEVDSTWLLRPEALAEAIDRDLAAG